MLAGIPCQEDLDEEEFRERMMKVVQDKSRKRYVCVIRCPREEFIGYSEIHIAEDDRNTAAIFFFVQDAYQGKGLGWAILNHIVEEAPSLGLKKLAAQVYCENKKAIRMLKRFNFNVQKESVDPESGKRSYVMHREVFSYSYRIVNVQGVRYRVAEESEIKRHVSEVLRADWEEDEFMKEWYPEMDEWDWTVERLSVSDISLWRPLMEDPGFIPDLERRVRAQKELLLEDEIVEPVVVRGRDMLIYDGYARLHALKELGKSEILAYVGWESHHT